MYFIAKFCINLTYIFSVAEDTTNMKMALIMIGCGTVGVLIIYVIVRFWINKHNMW